MVRFSAPGLGQTRQSNTATERSQLKEYRRVGEMLKRSIKPRSKVNWVDDLTDPPDLFSGLLAFGIPVQDPQSTGKAVP